MVRPLFGWSLTLTWHNEPRVSNHKKVTTGRFLFLIIFSTHTITLPFLSKLPFYCLPIEIHNHNKSIKENPTATMTTVYVKNIGSATEDKEIKDFFSFW